MEVREFEDLTKKLEDMKVKKTRAETMLESIKDDWKKYGITSRVEAVKMIKDIEKDIENDNVELTSLYIELKKLMGVA